MMFALTDIQSYNRSIYAKRGDEINIISRPHENVWICSTVYGDRFPCSPGKLTDEQPIIEQEVQLLRAPKSNDKDQLNLFGL